MPETNTATDGINGSTLTYSLWIEGQVAGPYNMSQIRAMLKDQTINLQVLCCRADEQDWFALEKIKGYIFQNPPPLPIRSPLPAPTIQRQTTSTSSDDLSHLLIILAGLMVACGTLLLGYFSTFYSITPPDSSTINLDLLSTRQNGIIVAVGLFVSGVLVAIVGLLHQISHQLKKIRNNSSKS